MLKNQRVYLQYLTAGTKTWRSVGSWATNSSGMITISVQPKRGTYYRWYYAGAPSVTAAYSANKYFAY